MMKAYYVYILKCADDTYYTGITSNLSQRFKEHHLGKRRGSYTYLRRPLQLVFCTKFESLSPAVHAEIRIKNWSLTKLEALIKGQEKLPVPLPASQTTSADHFLRESA